MESIRRALPALARRPGCVVNIGSSAGWLSDAYDGVEYAVAKAGVIRLTTALGTVDGVRVNCVAPHTVATPAVLRALETGTISEIAPPPQTLLPVDEMVAAVRRLAEDDSLAGCVITLSGRSFSPTGAPASPGDPDRAVEPWR